MELLKLCCMSLVRPIKVLIGLKNRDRHLAEPCGVECQRVGTGYCVWVVRVPEGF